MTQLYDSVHVTVGEGKCMDAKGDFTVVEGDYTDLGRRDPETLYEELKAWTVKPWKAKQMKFKFHMGHQAHLSYNNH